MEWRRMELDRGLRAKRTRGGKARREEGCDWGRNAAEKCKVLCGHFPNLFCTANCEVKATACTFPGCLRGEANCLKPLKAATKSPSVGGLNAMSMVALQWTTTQCW